MNTLLNADMHIIRKMSKLIKGIETRKVQMKHPLRFMYESCTRCEGFANFKYMNHSLLLNSANFQGFCIPNAVSKCYQLIKCMSQQTFGKYLT